MPRTVLITGASTGIGKATAELMYAQGWNVVASMRNPIQERESPRWLTPRLDVTDPVAVERVFTETAAHFGRIDVVVNNAGYGLSGTFEAMTEEQIHRQFDTNVYGVMRCCHAALPLLRRQGGGVIINVSSVAGRVTFPFYSVYHASKWAVEGFSESLQFEVAPHGIRVKLIEPGAIKTDFYERSADFAHDPVLNDYSADLERVSKRMKRMGAAGTSPEKVAATILHAATDASEQLRYPVGKDAHQMLGLRRWLGDNATRSVVRKRLFQ